MHRVLKRWVHTEKGFPSMPIKGRKRKDREILREDALRPSPYLGYGYLNLGNYFLQHRAFKLAETQFRRAIWLNPYEPKFLYELAVCLFEQGRLEEAMKVASRVKKTGKFDSLADELLELLGRSHRRRSRMEGLGGG